jgi:Tol biopolymer transport system component
VLYEMLTGRQPFAGPTVSDTLAAVLKTEPEWELVPSEMRRIVRRCLTKDPRLRLRDIGEARIAIEQPATELSEHLPVRSRAWLPWAAAAILLGAIAGSVSLRHFQEKPFEPPPVRFTVTPPGVTRQFFQEISPDGRKIAFVVHEASSLPRIWVRALDRLEAQPVAGTEGAGTGFFWSPDSRFLAFQVGTQLKKIEATGGTPQLLTTIPVSFVTGTWGYDGTILVGGFTEPIYRLSVSGGEYKPLTELDVSAGETGHVSPRLLPDGRHFVYLALRKGTSTIWVTSVDNPKARRRLLDSTRSENLRLAYSQGHLLFGRNLNLMAQAFDPDRLELRGEPVTLAENILSFSASGNGVLTYRSRADNGLLSRLTWFEREGKALGVAGPAGNYFWVALSPDQSRIAVSNDDPRTGQDVMVIDPTRGTSMRLTSHPARDSSPVWSPDGSRIVFNSDRDGSLNLYQKPSNGSGQEEILLKNASNKTPLDWSSDGRYLLYSEFDNRNMNDLWVLPMTGERKSIPFSRTEFNEGSGKFSPDGRWIAYVSDESARYQVYVQSFPPGSGKWQISAEGGGYPAWRRDGRELYYLTLDGDLMAVEIRIGAGFQAGVPKRLFKASVTGTPYGVSADGRRFLMPVPVESNNIGLINVVVNWTAELNK